MIDIRRSTRSGAPARTSRARYAAFVAIAAALAGTPMIARAQGLSLWVGAGQKVSRDSIPRTLKNADLYAGLQLDVPVLPVAFRADASVGNADFRDGQRSATASVVLPLRIPVVEPYGMIGYGVYDWGKSYEERGISYGAGVRVHVSRLGAFAQVRRHEVLKRSIGTIGLTF